MSRPTPGTYYIYNRVHDSDGNQLAMTFNGNGRPITVTPLDTGDSRQKWVIQNYDRRLQHIKPRDNQNLEAGWGDTIYTLPVGNYVWSITKDDGYVITDGGNSIHWGIEGAYDGAAVIPSDKGGDEKKRWVFQRA
ncbi:hypothetical protein NLI96_g3820 [Meripilus lineatus]|uniref:CCL2-like lectin domain-containing protein n=1 Tax=Meripilus lineatus TaxID=2056292 RepID=A0AAD5V5Q9_9APHY|nr:hypothetical protein NLI96_g3820 [Physisporinus lineatus]